MHSSVYYNIIKINKEEVISVKNELWHRRKKGNLNKAHEVS